MNKPVTGNLSSAAAFIILCSVPAHAVEHLVHAWDALSIALDESSKLDGGDRGKVTGNIKYAQLRLAHAVDAVPRVGQMKRPPLRHECIELAKAIDDAVRYF